MSDEELKSASPEDIEKAEKSLDFQIKQSELAKNLMQLTVMKVGIWASAGAFLKFIIEFAHKLITGGN